tara:strand:+ start:4234 stop:4482 length:249 start_codon:yes stop_codon:yes gene_type:complete
MIFPDVTLEEWLKRYPELEVIEGTCRFCGNKRRTTKPFITKDYAELRSKRCSCGKDHHISSTSIPISKSEIEFWNCSDLSGV